MTTIGYRYNTVVMLLYYSKWYCTVNTLVYTYTALIVLHYLGSYNDIIMYCTVFPGSELHLPLVPKLFDIGND